MRCTDYGKCHEKTKPPKNLKNGYLYCNTRGVPAVVEQTGIIPKTSKLYQYKISFPPSGSKSTLFLPPGMAVYMLLNGIAGRASPFD
jgi:hypothetical protein